jgi:PKD repeat protein
VTVVATPVGSNYQTTLQHTADLRLTTPGVILPPAGTPTPRFTFSPSAPAISTPVLFDASTSCAEGGTCSSSAGIVSFTWLFGDGEQGTGERPTHTYDVPGTYNVTLTVRNSRGLSASTTLPVTIEGGTPPVADFVFSPSAPLVGQEIQFNASTSIAAPGRRIVEYRWNWGDGAIDEGRLENHSYDTAGTYNVVLTVIDDVGRRGTVTKPVPVGSGNPVASFTISPQPPVGTGVSLTFDASASAAAAGSTIVSYTWSFGDGSGSGPNPTATVSTDYDDPGTYTVTLTVTDSIGRTASVSQAVRIE